MKIREISCLATAVVIGFCGGLRGKEVFMTSLKGMLKLWEETKSKKYCPHAMVTLKGGFKRETIDTCHMLLLVYTTGLGIEVSKWVERWLEVLLEEDRKLEGGVLQIEGGERTMIQDLYEFFHEVLKELEARGGGIDAIECGY